MSKFTAPSQRQLRVGELIRHELSTIFSRDEIIDSEIERVGVTVYEVAMSPDLKHATCWVRPFRSGAGQDLVNALQRHHHRPGHCREHILPANQR